MNMSEQTSNSTPDPALESSQPGMVASIEAPKPKTQEDAMDAPEARRRLVNELTETVRSDRTFWQPVFERVREDERFAAGDQWGSAEEKNALGLKKYSANIVQRQNALKVSQLYAKNPTPVCKRRPKMDFMVWDGTQTQLQQARAAVAAAMQQMGQIQPGQQPPPPPEPAATILKDYANGIQNKKKYDKISETLQMLADKEVSEQQPEFFTQMWQLVLRAVTTNVGFLKVAYQREDETMPTSSTTTTGFLERLQMLKAKAQELEQDDADPDSSLVEELKILTLQLAQAAQQGEQKVLREGLVFDFPPTTAIIVDRNCRLLTGFVGADWIAQEFLMTPEQILKQYNVDIRESAARQYVDGTEKESGQKDQGLLKTAVNWIKSKFGGWKDGAKGCVWEIYRKSDQIKYVICDGYPDFLEEPETPNPEITGFWPIGAYVKNPIEVEENRPKEFCTIYGESDVRLMRSQQEELNRSREALRLHRIHNKDVYCYPEGQLNKTEMDNLSAAPSGAFIPIAALAAGQKLADIVQPIQHSQIDPSVYDAKHVMQDVMLTVGSQDADLGNAPSGQTATGQSIAATSRMTVSSSEIDRLDKFLTWAMRTGGEMLLMLMNGDTVRQKVGPGAAWPMFDRQAIKNEIYLEIEAGSTGRPNKAVDVQNLTQALPWLQNLWALKGLDPTPLIKYGLTVLDAKIDLDELIDEATSQAQPGGAPGGGPPGKGPAGPAESISIKLPDLAPSERVQALRMFGIQAAGAGELAAHAAMMKPPTPAPRAVGAPAAPVHPQKQPAQQP